MARKTSSAHAKETYLKLVEGENRHVNTKPKNVHTKLLFVLTYKNEMTKEPALGFKHGERRALYITTTATILILFLRPSPRENNAAWKGASEPHTGKWQ